MCPTVFRDRLEVPGRFAQLWARGSGSTGCPICPNPSAGSIGRWCPGQCCQCSALCPQPTVALARAQGFGCGKGSGAGSGTLCCNLIPGESVIHRRSRERFQGQILARRRAVAPCARSSPALTRWPRVGVESLEPKRPWLRGDATWGHSPQPGEQPLAHFPSLPQFPQLSAGVSLPVGLTADRDAECCMEAVVVAGTE